MARKRYTDRRCILSSSVYMKIIAKCVGSMAVIFFF